MLLTTEDCPKNDEERAFAKDRPYCMLVKNVLYLVTTTLLDIAIAIRELAEFMSNYGPKHWLAAKHLR